MNISPQDISGVCNLKCSYSYNYPITTPTITNYSTHLVASYINSTTSSVSFNDEPYNIADICIFSPSLHTYNNTLTNGEIVITHAPVNGGNVLFVCSPISETGVQVIRAFVLDYSKQFTYLLQTYNYCSK